MLKKIVYSVVGLIVLVLLIGFVLPAKLEISKRASIHASAPAVFEEINNLERWEQWQYWNTLDPDMKITYGDIKEGTGAMYSWTGPKMGEGTLGITESIPNKSIAIDMKFSDSPAKGFYELVPDGENTTLHFNFSNDAGMNPIGRWINVFMKSEIEKSFVYAGEKIKEIAEAKPTFSFEINQVEVSELRYVGLSHTMSPKDLLAVNAQMAKMFTELDATLRKASIPVTGHPFCLYPAFSEVSMDIVCAMPVDANVKLPSKLTLQTLQGGTAVKGILKGDYQNLQAIHRDIQKYIQYKNLTESGAPWEVYVTDPMSEKDTTKWITEVYYPVSKK